MAAPLTEVYEKIVSAREAESVLRARDAYLEECSRMPLGQYVEVRPTRLGFELRANSDIPDETPVCAFAPDAMAVVGSPRRSPPNGKRIVWGGQGTNIYGPLSTSETEATLDLLMDSSRIPVTGFLPANSILFDAPLERPPTPDLAACYVGSVVKGDPYEGLDIPAEGPYSDGLVRTLAQITVAYIQKIQALGNVFIGTCPGKPAVLITTRPISKGEVLRTGRTPLHLLKGRVDLLRAIERTLKENLPAAQGISIPHLARVLGLPE